MKNYNNIAFLQFFQIKFIKNENKKHFEIKLNYILSN